MATTSKKNWKTRGLGKPTVGNCESRTRRFFVLVAQSLFYYHKRVKLIPISPDREAGREEGKVKVKRAEGQEFYLPNNYNPYEKPLSDCV